MDGNDGQTGTSVPVGPDEHAGDEAAVVTPLEPVAKWPFPTGEGSQEEQLAAAARVAADVESVRAMAAAANEAPAPVNPDMMEVMVNGVKVMAPIVGRDVNTGEPIVEVDPSMLRPADGNAHTEGELVDVETTAPAKAMPKEDLAVFGPQADSVRAMCEAGGVNYESIRDKAYAVIRQAEEMEAVLIEDLMTHIPVGAHPPVLPGVTIVHHLQEARSMLMSLMQQHQMSDQAAQMWSQKLSDINAHVCGYISATVTKELVRVKMPNKERDKTMQRFNLVAAHKQQSFDAIGNAIREAGATIQAALQTVVDTSGAAATSSADNQVH